MIAKHHFEKTFNLATAQNLQTWANNNLIGGAPPHDNPYLEDATIPPYDSGSSEHLLITTTNGKWTEGNLNNTNYTHFYIEPGDYTGSGQLNITRSGTNSKRRTLSLHNGDNTHPGKLNKSQLANIGLKFKGASYWTLDRLAMFDFTFTYSIYIDKNSTHNIFNRMFADNVWSAFTIRDGAHNNTIQSSRLTNMTRQGFADDVAMINIVSPTGEANPFNVHNTKIIGNEFVDCKPGRVNRYFGGSTHGQYAYFDGTIFAYNNVEYTTAKRTDGKGNYTTTGDYYAGEATGFTTKSGSGDVNNPILIERNHVWGMRPNDPTMPHLSNIGTGFTMYYGSDHVKVLNNYIFDGTLGLFAADKEDAQYGTDNLEIRNNVIVDCGARPGGMAGRSIKIAQAHNFTVKNNLIKDSIAEWMWLEWNFSGGYVGENDAVNPGAAPKIKNNPTIDGLTTNTEYATPQDGGYVNDYSFTTDEFTNTPKTMKLEKVLK